MPKRIGLWAVLLAATFAACSSQEDRVLRRFLTAVQTKDRAMLSALSAATFPWVIESWEIIGTQSETTEPFRMFELERQAGEAQQKREDLFKEQSRFVVDNYDALKVVKARVARDPDCTFKGKLATVHEELMQHRKELKELEQLRRALERQAGRERRLARMSLMGAISEVSEFDGDVSVKKVLVAITGEGNIKSNYVVTLSRYNLANRENNFRPNAVWIITDIEEQLPG